jgi:ubiquinol-cytochrome c reductase iron-sulfur subunit|tara:strand:+ start:4862 stop:5449 length:588 start_codon:yes stop_codon:yes gene_type:complete
MSKLDRRKFLSVATSVTSVIGGIFAITPFILSFQPSKKAKALGAAIKVDLSNLEAGSIIKVIYRGTPYYVVHRSEDMIERLKSSENDLRDPDSDLSVQPNFAKNEFRSMKPKYLVVEGVCTHLGCAPIEKFSIAPADMGPDWNGGFYCPCHGSKFDLSGRVYSGVPAPSNLRVPPHRFENNSILVVGENPGEANV